MQYPNISLIPAKKCLDNKICNNIATHIVYDSNGLNSGEFCLKHAQEYLSLLKRVTFKKEENVCMDK